MNPINRKRMLRNLCLLLFIFCSGYLVSFQTNTAYANNRPTASYADFELINSINDAGERQLSLQAIVNEVDMTNGTIKKQKIMIDEDFYVFNNPDETAYVSGISTGIGLGKNKEKPQPIYLVVNFMKNKNGSDEAYKHWLIRWAVGDHQYNVVREFSSSESLMGIYREHGLFSVSEKDNKGRTIYKLARLSDGKTMRQVPAVPNVVKDIHIKESIGDYYKTWPPIGSLYWEEPHHEALLPNGKMIKLQPVNPVDPFRVNTVKHLGDATYKKVYTKKGWETTVERGDKKIVLNQYKSPKTTYTMSFESFSPNNKYIVVLERFIKNSRLVKDRVVAKVFDVQAMKWIREIEFNSPNVGDGEKYFLFETDEVVYGPLLYHSKLHLLTGVRFKAIDPPDIGALFYSNVDQKQMITTGITVPIKVGDKYVTYSGQGSFRSKDGAVYAPVRALARTIGAEVKQEKKGLRITKGTKGHILDSAVTVNWKGETFYPLNRIADALGYHVKSSTPNGFMNGGYARIELVPIHY